MTNVAPRKKKSRERRMPLLRLLRMRRLSKPKLLLLRRLSGTITTAHKSLSPRPPNAKMRPVSMRKRPKCTETLVRTLKPTKTWASPRELATWLRKCVVRLMRPEPSKPKPERREKRPKLLRKQERLSSTTRWQELRLILPPNLLPIRLELMLIKRPSTRLRSINKKLLLSKLVWKVAPESLTHELLNCTTYKSEGRERSNLPSISFIQ